jgi:hypothetical protein
MGAKIHEHGAIVIKHFLLELVRTDYMKHIRCLGRLNIPALAAVIFAGTEISSRKQR